MELEWWTQCDFGGVFQHFGKRLIGAINRVSEPSWFALGPEKARRDAAIRPPNVERQALNGER
jgi:hypothetical protein